MARMTDAETTAFFWANINRHCEERHRRLFYGNSDNDSNKRGRRVKTSEPPNHPWRLHDENDVPNRASVTDSDTVAEIRKLYVDDDLSQKRIAKQFGISQKAVSDIVADIYKPTRKLTTSQVNEIRQAYATGKHKQRDLADRYGVSVSCICMLVKDVESSARPVVLTDETINAIREAYKAGGVTQVELAQKFGCAQNTVSRILRGG